MYDSGHPGEPGGVGLGPERDRRLGELGDLGHDVRDGGGGLRVDEHVLGHVAFLVDQPPGDVDLRQSQQSVMQNERLRALGPWDPPKRLVIVGLYRFVRNPMYVAVLTILVGWALLYRSWLLRWFPTRLE